jgi:hypothetical protein
MRLLGCLRVLLTSFLPALCLQAVADVGASAPTGAVDKRDAPAGAVDKRTPSAVVMDVEPEHPFNQAMPDLQGPTSLGVNVGHLALIMMSELAFEVGELLRDSLAVVLQQTFLGLHNQQPLVYEHSRMLLLNLVRRRLLSCLQYDGILVWYFVALCAWGAVDCVPCVLGTVL